MIRKLFWPGFDGLTLTPYRYDFRNKRIGVIGNGSSAIQIVPNLQQLEGVTLKSFMRSPTWISSTFGDAAMIQLGMDPKKIECRLFSPIPIVPFLT